MDVVCKDGQLDLTAPIMSAMQQKKFLPNVVTYGTVIEGYAKAGDLDEAQKLYHDMKYASKSLDRVSHGTLLSTHA